MKIINANLSDMEIEGAQLGGVEITDCNIAGMTINGIPVEELLAR